VAFDEGYEFAKAHKLEFTEVSALNADNIAKAFELLAKRVITRLGSSGPQLNNHLPQRL
jgi:hypothetical protein